MRNHPASQHLPSAAPRVPSASPRLPSASRRLGRRLLASVWLRAALLALLVGLVGLVPLMLRSEEGVQPDGTKEPKEAEALVRDPAAYEKEAPARCPRGTLEDGGACVPVPSVPSP